MDAINSNYETQQYSSLKNGIIGTLGVAAGWEGQTFITQKAKYPLKKYVKIAKFFVVFNENVEHDLQLFYHLNLLRYLDLIYQ